MRIARRFNGGKANQKMRVPTGRKKMLSIFAPDFLPPLCGAWKFLRLNPAVKTAGYFQIVPFGTKFPLDRKFLKAHTFLMSLDAFKRRWAENVPGKFYVSDQCLDCDYCREVAPENFARNDERGYSYVKKQPETQEELAYCREAIRGCCTETIFDDGDNFG